MTHTRLATLAALLMAGPAFAQDSYTPRPGTPDWAIPGSATHKQIPPPPDFHRPTVHHEESVQGYHVASIGAPLVVGSQQYSDGTFTVTSAGYNIWYTRDEFRYLYREMKGDVSLAADIGFPDPNGYGDRKAVLVIRQDLDDDSRQVVVALHGAGMIQLAQRPEKGALTKDREFRIGGRGRPEGKSPDSLVTVVRTFLVAVFSAVTFTPGSTPPLVSVTRPTMSAVPCAEAKGAISRHISNTPTRVRNRNIHAPCGS